MNVVTTSRRRRRSVPSTPHGEANRAASGGDGEYIVFLGEHTEVVEPDWIEQLLLYAEMPGVGAVGPTITRPDGRVDAAGYAIGLYDPAAPVMRGFDASADGYYGSLSCAREVSAVGMECMLVAALDLRAARRLRAGLSPPVPGPRPLPSDRGAAA